MWKQCSWLLAACAASVVPSAHAEEIVYPQRVVRTVHVSAPPAKVWAAIGNFSDMSWYPDAVASTEMISGEGNAKGAKRRITLKSGGTLEETLKLYPEGKTTYTYTLEAGVLPVSEYSSTIRVRAYEKGSEVTWIGAVQAPGCC